MNGSRSIFSRFKELGKYSPSQALRFIESYAPQSLKDKLFPFRSEAEKLFRDNYSEEQIAQMSLQSQKNIISSYAKYGRAAFNAFTPEENKEFLNSLNIDPLVPIPSTTRGIRFKARCMTCGHINEFNFQSNRIPTVCPFCNEAGKTRLESLIQKVLEDNGVSVLPKARGFITSELGFWQEIDIYIPSLKIGFEINGALTHNSGINPFHGHPKPKNYHKLKSDKALNKGILLYHIWEHWGDTDTLTNLVLAKCRIFRKTYYARKLKVVVNPPKKDVEDFLNRNHKQGFCRCSISVALYEDDRIIQFIGFVLTSDTAELVRNASEQGAQILGGLQRLFKYSLMELKSIGIRKIITFADRDLTPSPDYSVYSRLGFRFVEDSGQTMSYYIYKNRTYFDKQVYNRRYFQKQFLEKRLSVIPGWTFNEKESEQENLARAGIYPIYNSGCFKFEYCIK